MKKHAFFRTLLAWLLIPALLFAAPALSRGEELIGSEEEMLAALSLHRARGNTEFSLTLTGGYFSRLSANNFQEYTAVKLKAGVAQADMKYSAERLVLYLENVQWTEPRAMEISTEQEFRKAIRYYLETGMPEFQIILRDQRLFESLQENQRAFEYAAMYGADTLRVRTVNVSPYIFYLDEIQPFTLPWQTVASRDEWIRAVEDMAERNAGHFVLVLDPLFAETLQRDESLIGQMEAASPMAEWSLSYRTDYSRFEFSDVVFSPEPRIACETEDEVMEAIRQMGSSGLGDFTLILTPELFDRVSAGEFEGLSVLEADAGLSDRSLSYNPNLHTLTYSGAVIRSDARKLATPREAAAFLEKAVADGEETIALFCTPELYSLLAGDGGGAAPLSDLTVHAGIFHFTYTWSRASGLIKINITALYPGTKLLLAARRGDEAGLTPREAETLSAARQLAAACRDSDPLQTARKVHDALCGIISYTVDDDTEEDDTATGALLNGQANCDGYADAFYLVGTLAGLEVRYQHGDSKEKGADEQYRDVTHLWNLVRIDGSWRLVDVTWDDREDGIEYTWFNIGADRARLMHEWNEEMSVPLQAETVLSGRPESEYPVQSLMAAGSAAKDAAARGLPSFTLVFPGDTALGQDEVLDALRRNLNRSFSYEWNGWMKRMRVCLTP